MIETKDDPDLNNDKWRKDISLGAEHVLQESIITCSDPHYDAALASRCARAQGAIMFILDYSYIAQDAKLWVHMHPYGTGSLFSEPGSGGVYRLARNRLLLIQRSFRENTLYAFWYLNRVINKETCFVCFVQVRARQCISSSYMH